MNQEEDNIVISPFKWEGIVCCDVWMYIQEVFIHNKDGIALIDPLRNICKTFGELHHQIECVASNLLELGYDKNQPMVIYMENCVEFVVAMLAVWRVGGRVAVINHLLTADELHKYLEILDCDFIVCSQATASRSCKAIIGSSIKKTICTGDYPGCVSFLKFHSPKNNIPLTEHINPQNTALLAFSSGTTGAPKCVELSHRGLIEVTTGNVEATGINHLSNGGIIYQPLSHIYGVQVLLSFLQCGQKVILMSQFNLERFVNFIHKYKVEILFLVPPVAIMLCKSTLINKHDLSSIKTIFSGVAPLGKETEEELRKILTQGVKITQDYGLTELHGGGCVVRHWDSSAPAGSVGMLYPDTKVVDLDTGNNLGPGQMGEICFKCNYMMNGYFRNPKATADMIKNGWLYTGDIGYYDEKGYFFVVDRLKELIKYKGYQVSPSELESVLLAYPSIADAGVTSVPDEEAGELPQAWVVLKPGQTCSEAEIHAFVREKVAPFKRLRGGVKFVSAIPKSSNGKIMRRMMKQQATHCKI